MQRQAQEFLTSSFIRAEELPRILRRQVDDRLTVLPVYVSPSTVTSAAIDFIDAQGHNRRIVLSDFQGFGTPDQTLSELELPERQRRFVALHDRIRELSATATAQENHLEQKGSRITRILLPQNRAFTRALTLDRNVEAAGLLAATLGWLEHHRDWLLVFDNAEHPDDIRDLLPKTGTGGIIITSRFPAWRAVAQTVMLGLWTAQEAAERIRTRPKSRGPEREMRIDCCRRQIPLSLS